MAKSVAEMGHAYCFDAEIVGQCEQLVDAWLNRQPRFQREYRVPYTSVPQFRTLRSLDMDELLRRYREAGWETTVTTNVQDSTWSEIILRQAPSEKTL